MPDAVKRLCKPF